MVNLASTGQRSQIPLAQHAGRFRVATLARAVGWWKN